MRLKEGPTSPGSDERLLELPLPRCNATLPVDVSFFQIWPTNFRRNTVGVVPNQFRRNDGWDHTDKAKYRELTLKPGV